MRELLSGRYILYYHPHCGACKKQFRDLGISKSHGRDCSTGNYPHIRAFPTWHNTKTGLIYEGYIHPKDIRKKLEKRKNVSYRKSRFGTPPTYGDQALIDCSKGGRGGNNIGPSTIPQLWEGLVDTYNGRTKFGSAPLPRPYGPSDNANMQASHYAGSLLPPLPLDMYTIGQFGSRKIKLRNRKKNRSLKKIYNSRKFGSTPGTKQWWETGTVRPEGPILFYEGPPGSQLDPNDSINVPMQFSNNRLNRFGWNLASISGPNRVAYEPNIPMYYAGANTTNFLSGRPYRPEQCPTTSVGGTSVGGTSVQPDPYTRNGWLSSGPNLLDASSISNGARSYTYKGLTGRFGNRNRFGNAAGPQIIVNTLPARLTTMGLTEGRSDAAYANFGRKKQKDPYYAKVTLRNNKISVKKKRKFSKNKTLE